MPRMSLVVFLSLLIGCGSKHRNDERYAHGLGMQGSGGGGGGAGMGTFGARGKQAEHARRSRPSAAPAIMAAADAGGEYYAEEAEAEPEEDASGEPQARMVHYNGHVRLEVSRPDETITAIVAHAKEIGGYVERQTRTSVSLRVPVKTFKQTFDWVKGQGDVLSKSMSARDVTSAHFALELRLNTAKKTRDRLQQLLARTQDETTKIALLKQIQRLTEQIDRMERQEKTLSRLADMSRLTVEAQSRSAMVGAKNVVPIAGFEWISQLSPFARAVAQDGELHTLGTPQGLVALTKKDHFQAESADGVVLWTAQLENQPQGSAEFWRSAIQTRIAKEFASAEVGVIGPYLTLRLVAPSESPYVYIIALKVDGDELHLVEAYYPSQEAEKRHRPQIEAVLGGGAS